MTKPRQFCWYLYDTYTVNSVGVVVILSLQVSCCLLVQPQVLGFVLEPQVGVCCSSIVRYTVSNVLLHE